MAARRQDCASPLLPSVVLERAMRHGIGSVVRAWEANIATLGILGTPPPTARLFVRERTRAAPNSPV